MRRNHWNSAIRILSGCGHKAEAEHTSPITHCYRRPGSPLAEVHASSRVSTAASHAQLRLRPDKSMPCGSVDPSVYYRDRSRIPHALLCADTKDKRSHSLALGIPQSLQKATSEGSPDTAASKKSRFSRSAVAAGLSWHLYSRASPVRKGVAEKKTTSDAHPGHA